MDKIDGKRKRASVDVSSDEIQEGEDSNVVAFSCTTTANTAEAETGGHHEEISRGDNSDVRPAKREKVEEPATTVAPLPPTSRS